MTITLTVVLAIVSSICLMQAVAAIEARPNVTDTSVRICGANTNGNQEQACGVHELWCTQRSYGQQGAVSGQCAPCLTSATGYPQRLVVADQTNFCNCPVGHYCRQITNYNDAGYCVPYTRIGLSCSSDTDCVSAIGHSYGSVDLTDQTTQEGRLFCYEGTCSECQPDAWAQGTNTLPGLSAQGQPYTCPGIDMPMSAQLGFYYYLSNRPGETRTCLANGTLVGGGSINYALVSRQLSTTTASSSSSSSATLATSTSGDQSQDTSTGVVFSLAAATVAMVAAVSMFLST